MELYQSVFERYEKKYVITDAQKEELLSEIEGKLVPDEFGESTVCNLYFDTPDFRIIRASIERPVYKEKLRLRSYGIPDENSNVFVELKKKYNGVVYKRRINMTYGEAVDFLCRRNFSKKGAQVYSEIAYFMGFYRSLRPTVSIFCDRTAYFASENRDVRVTFDRNIRFRNQRLDLSTGSQGIPILESGLNVMEVKTLGAVPLWFSSALDKLGIYPRPFSKYGKAYEIINKKIVASMKQ